jgi:hypothetical protein
LVVWHNATLPAYVPPLLVASHRCALAAPLFEKELFGMHPNRPRFSRIALTVLCALLLGSTVIPLPTAEAIDKSLLLGDSLEQLSRGSFQLTSLASVDADGPSGNDLLGGVQLAPVGVITNWVGTDSSRDLPVPSTSHAAVYLNGRIYVLGGVLDPEGPASNVLTDTVLSAGVQLTRVSPTQDNRGQLIVPPGAESAWRNEASLTVASDDGNPNTTEQAPRAQIAAAALARPNGGYIYAIGGVYDEPEIDQLSTVDVSIATVDATGALTWRKGPSLNVDGVPRAVQAASAFVHTAANGKPYLYVIGGLTRRLNAFESEELGSREVLRAEIDPNSGNLIEQTPGTPASAWQRQGEVPVLTDTQATDGVPADQRNRLGIWQAGAFVSRVTGDDGVSFRDVVYLIGGQTGSSLEGTSPATRYSAKVYQGFINENGDLSWTPPDQYVGALTSAWYGHTAIEYRKSVFVIGGTAAVNNALIQARNSVQASLILTDTRLAKLGDPQEFAIDNSVLRFPRFNHASVVVPADPEKGAFVYVIGGSSNSAPSNSEVFYGDLSSRPENPQYAPGGYYYSPVVDVTRLAGVNAPEGQLKTLSWATTITRTTGMDIQLQYRYTTANTMPENEGWLTATNTAAGGFGSITGADGQNSATLLARDGVTENPPARLVQFRARLIAEGGTPILRKVAIQVSFPGSPNLKFPDNPFEQTINIQGGKPVLDGLSVKIANKDSADQPTRDAGFEQGGIFYVDLFINPAAPPTIGQAGQAYACVPKGNMPANGELTIARWYDPTDGGGCSKEIAITSLLQNAGNYTIYAYVDSIPPENLGSSPVGNVTEGAAGSPNESDNVTLAPLAITLAADDTPVPPNCTTLPLAAGCPVFRDPDPTVSTSGPLRFPIVIVQR